MVRLISRTLQILGFFGMVFGLFTTCTILKGAVVMYFVGFLLFLTFRKDSDATA